MHRLYETNVLTLTELVEKWHSELGFRIKFKNRLGRKPVPNQMIYFLLLGLKQDSREKSITLKKRENLSGTFVKYKCQYDYTNPILFLITNHVHVLQHVRQSKFRIYTCEFTFIRTRNDFEFCICIVINCGH